MNDKKLAISCFIQKNLCIKVSLYYNNYNIPSCFYQNEKMYKNRKYIIYVYSFLQEELKN